MIGWPWLDVLAALGVSALLLGGLMGYCCCVMAGRADGDDA